MRLNARSVSVSVPHRTLPTFLCLPACPPHRNPRAASRKTTRLTYRPCSKTLSTSLQTLHASAAHPLAALPSVPPELLEYVENGRNPDIYTREFVELVRRGNQLMRGKAAAFDSLRDVLAADMAAAMPELRDDVERVLEATGGKALGGARAADVTGASAVAGGGGGGGDGDASGGAGAAPAAGAATQIPAQGGSAPTG